MTKKKILLITCFSVVMFIYSFALFEAGRFYAFQKYEQNSQASAESHYIVKEQNNMIGVFEDDSDVPTKVLNIDVSTLRKQDRLKFQEGIVINTLDELTQLEEDFCS